MKRSLLVKLPALLIAGLLLWFGSGPLAWGLAALVLLLGVLALAYFVFHPNAGLWAPVRFRGPSQGAVALTFDDGPDPRFTPAVLAILAEKRVPATFFVVGSRVTAHPELVAAIHAAGHLVGNHSHSHDLGFHFRLWRGVREELSRCSAAIRAVIHEEPALFRSPQGFKNPALGDVLYERGMVAIGWQARGYDAIGTSAETIERRILESIEPGGVVLLHDGSGLNGTDERAPTLAALPRIIDAIRARGLSIVPLDQLLGIPAYHSQDRAERAPSDAALSPASARPQPHG